MNLQPDLKPKALPLEEGCKYIGVGKTTLYGLFRAGKLKPIKIGRKTVVLTADLDAFLDNLADREAA